MRIEDYPRPESDTGIGFHAQAIAARSYALSGPRHPGKGADLCTTTHCQV